MSIFDRRYAHRQTLITVSLRENHITNKGLESLADSLLVNKVVLFRAHTLLTRHLHLLV